MSRHEAVGAGTLMFALIAGSLAGAAVALLFAPAAGDETRQFLNEKAREGRERAAAAANAAVTAASTILSQSFKGSVADDLLAKGIAEVKAKLN